MKKIVAAASAPMHGMRSYRIPRANKWYGVLRHLERFGVLAIRYGFWLAQGCVIGTARAKNARNPPRTVFAGIHVRHSSMTIEGWMPSEIEAISPLVDQLMRLIEGLRCVAGDEFAVELALREALSNAVIHGNGMDAHRSVEVRCRCEQGKGLWLTVKDQGKGFDPTAIADPLGSRGREAERGRGIHLMKLVMDEVSFKGGGTEVHMRKGPGRQAVELPSND